MYSYEQLIARNRLVRYQCNYMPNHEYNDIIIPYMPIMGALSPHKMVQKIYKTIVDEATAAEFYSRLIIESPNEFHRQFIENARNDELEHLNSFIRLYCHFTGHMPNYNITPIMYPNYKEGVLIALKDELEGAEFYRDMQLSTSDQLIKDTFYIAMVDELEHANMFSTLYNSYEIQL